MFDSITVKEKVVDGLVQKLYPITCAKCDGKGFDEGVMTQSEAFVVKLCDECNGCGGWYEDAPRVIPKRTYLR